MFAYVVILVKFYKSGLLSILTCELLFLCDGNDKVKNRQKVTTLQKSNPLRLFLVTFEYLVDVSLQVLDPPLITQLGALHCFRHSILCHINQGVPILRLQTEMLILFDIKSFYFDRKCELAECIKSNFLHLLT